MKDTKDSKMDRTRRYVFEQNTEWTLYLSAGKLLIIFFDMSVFFLVQSVFLSTLRI